MNETLRTTESSQAVTYTANVATSSTEPNLIHEKEKPIPALTQKNNGVQFVLIGDSHSTRSGTQFRAVNAIIDRLNPVPQFVCLAGDHIWGWTEDETAMRQQWKEWREQNQDLLRHRIFHCTANHTILGPKSTAVYRETFPDIPTNGPKDGKILNYFIREKDFLLIVVNTAWGEPHNNDGDHGYAVDTDWVEQVLSSHHDAKIKFVMGHHPVFPVKGFDKGWLVAFESGEVFWKLLVKHGVRAYLCAHVIAFDVQSHQGVLQITSGGGGFNSFLGLQDTEFHHCVQLSADPDNLRLQVIDTKGQRRASLRWPFTTPEVNTWTTVEQNGRNLPNLIKDLTADIPQQRIALCRFRGKNQNLPNTEQLFLSGGSKADEMSLWIGLNQGNLEVRLAPISANGERKPVLVWHGPQIPIGNFDLQLAIHPGMGPGGFLFRDSSTEPWTSMTSKEARGVTVIHWPTIWKSSDVNELKIECTTTFTSLE